ncbi:MAG: hypothetical protein KME60_33300 [Cyanomargarita calcarea GSE-NOS-MK-12-04C]|uniref:Uncharacterized protein n=1 Tax=Cyanomargarita calcarea GSE-NOS-MK-12-04C TaxID=2839659 RepID=A0A951QXZ1_9CYAN|nr:hypothetical protein [Cyanomargarita calcarea GSE-NOS-MK-12-04C]
MQSKFSGIQERNPGFFTQNLALYPMQPESFANIQLLELLTPNSQLLT